jgi:hypothetical protein
MKRRGFLQALFAAPAMVHAPALPAVAAPIAAPSPYSALIAAGLKGDFDITPKPIGGEYYWNDELRPHWEQRLAMERFNDLMERAKP